MTRAYRSRDTLREVLLDEGVQLLASEGFQSGNLTLVRVFERIEARGEPRITKGSVLGPDRIWPSQRDYQLDVEVRAIEQWAEDPLDLAATMTAAEGVLAKAKLTTVAGRRAAVRELCRVAAERNFSATQSSQLWKLVVALWGRSATSRGSEEGRRIGEAIDRATRKVTELLVRDVYGLLAQAVGYRGRAEYGTTEDALWLLAVTAYAVSDGLMLRAEHTNDLRPIERSTGVGDEVQEWGLFGLAFEALVNQFLEPTPSR